MRSNFAVSALDLSGVRTIRKLQLVLRRVFNTKNLHERAVAQIAVGLQVLHEVFKGQVLIRVSAERSLSDSL